MSQEDFQTEFNKAWKLRNAGELQRVIEIVNKWLPKTQAMDDKASTALFLKLLAQVHTDQNELKEALKLYKQAERLYIELEDAVKQMHTLRHIGTTFYELGEITCAQKCLVQVIDAYHELSLIHI